jgi:hypothetical protein
MNSIRVKPEEARARVLAALRAHDYKGKTSELAEWTGMQSSVVRRAALYLAAQRQIVAVLLPGPGRSRGEYLFHLQQLDLFEDQKPPATIWQKVKKWFR